MTGLWGPPSWMRLEVPHTQKKENGVYAEFSRLKFLVCKYFLLCMLLYVISLLIRNNRNAFVFYNKISVHRMYLNKLVQNVSLWWQLLTLGLINFIGTIAKGAFLRVTLALDPSFIYIALES